MDSFDEIKSEYERLTSLRLDADGMRSESVALTSSACSTGFLHMRNLNRVPAIGLLGSRLTAQFTSTDESIY